MPQEQRVIQVILLDGVEHEASATGNNAAWLCPCGYELPLLGRTDTRENSRVECRDIDCTRAYTVVPEGEPSPALRN